MSWIRVRFRANSFNPKRSLPPFGPYWSMILNNDNSVTIVAFVRKLSNIHVYWPTAKEIEHMGAFESIKYSQEFPKPNWWVV